MKRPHLSTGAWIFTGLVTAAVVAPTAVYAAATSTVAIGDTHSTTTAVVTPNHQLLTTTIPPKNVVAASGSANEDCGVVYTPPAGKAIVVSSVTYDVIDDYTTEEHYAYLTDASCSPSHFVDDVETTQTYATESRTFPIGLPLPSVGVYSGGVGITTVYVTGYLIPASQLPATPPATKLPARLARPTH